MLTPTYMDYSSTTPVDPRVAKKMAKYLTMEGDFGNAASRSHYYGWQAEKAVDEARSQVADLVGADPREIVWTSGATESNNLAIKGIANFYHKRGKHIITLKTAKSYLCKSNGSFIIKTFQNSLLKKLRTEMEKSFHLVQTYKPAASKSKSGEIYLYGERSL